ncbi:DEAD/DEAH box helicase family protein [Bradyrhizobium tropiciagri]|uniref:DEAD/DEAH box helicase family protein n=1 Tax=Bradyrhizobium tropiciagri TaxID=312253 RepID=UPI001BACF9BE|nr:DEAD/DEAH box helicase family protein [Bradyrhizobium tropiciagri]MBR0869640.1 DEAD/DEAH box helicase family protein [Bradyrhizobium tropiciagri]
MELFPFQAAAASQIAERFQTYMQDPLTVTRRQLVPFYQNLSAITGSGKTLILADAVEQIRSQLSVEPIVLWLSKGRIVVWQTLTNLSTGKYSSLVGEFDVTPLLECSPEAVADSSRGLLLIATVGRFNQRDKEEGDRRIFRVGLDVAEQSLWDQLKERRDRQGRRRPLIVVYDEGHNLSDQQTQLLMELMPDALIAASATTRVPQALSSTIERLRNDKRWTDDDLVTKLRSSDVVSSGLVKKNIMLGGYLTPMELAVDDMLAEMKQATQAAHDLGLTFRPKAIYVATTNVPEGGTMREDAARPFNERQARPIQIWRHLVENAKIDPAKIAVYCDLRFDSKFPPPRGFNLFAGGDSDYDTFIAGGYEHIIFNLGLQEGWDEPECAFAYIDKDMGSPDQVTQIVGRVLRQPGAQHYAAPSLNTAHFYIRTDERGVFEAILQDVERKLAADSPEITLTVRRTTKGGSRVYAEATKQRQVPTVSIDSSEARVPVGRIVDRIVDFRQGGPSTIGKGGRIQVLQTIGEGTTQTEEWVEVEHSNRVTARWILRREIQQLFPAQGDRTLSPINICDIEHPKFDALVEYNSAAADHLREQAHGIVKTYIERSKLVQNALDHPYVVGDVPIDEAKLTLFKNAIHRGYSGLNNDERPFAEALDKTKRVWCRNPSQGGFSIPLLDHGNTRTFSPDFLVWLDKVVFALDTKGDHLITEDAGRKLFDIEPIEDGLLLVIRLITRGEWSIAPTGEFNKRSGSTGHTVWRLRNGRIQPTHTETIAEAIEACLQK